MMQRGANCVRNLIAKTALQGKFTTYGSTVLSEVDPGPITSLAPYPGKKTALSKLLPMTFPAPNRFATKDGATLVWTGPDQAFLIGMAAPETPMAAQTDQSGGWTALRLSGPLAEPSLCRLVPLDLRAAVFAPGHAARAPLGHMNMILLRTAPDGFLILIFRSMARTAWHEVETALKSLTARASLTNREKL